MSQEQMLREVFEMVAFIKDHAATHEDLQNLKTELREEIRGVRDELQETKSEIISHIDQFVALHQKLEIEFLT